ncbi:hypothetical protein [Streptomyces sp. NPDC001985]|uniref:hypothetical protein n=1 Tax=Streptomyces sp. NPDC001985 TaxID=3154406 RepID=UPI00331B4E79
MQTSALPDLAHTRTRPVHWLATAAAMAAVVAFAGLVQPGAATASHAGEGPTTRSGPGPADTAAPAPDPDRVTLGPECGRAAAVVVKEATGDLDGDGRPETVVAARCDAGGGNPPSGIYVLAADRKGAPRVVATLLDPAERQSVGELAVRDGAVAATLFGYSSPDVPSCCPDVRDKAEWRWKGGKFLRTAQSEPRAL